MYNICIDKIRFVWDEEKNQINQEKHGVSFEEAQTAFYDDYALLEFDEEHSELEEDRFRILGLSKKRPVAYCGSLHQGIRICHQTDIFEKGNRK